MENTTPILPVHLVPERHELRARLFKALGHPVRMAILEHLLAADGERCVCEFQDEVLAATGVGLPTLSKHLSVLTEAGVTSRKRKGTFIYYTVEMRCVATFLACVDTHVLNQPKRGETPS